jgi:hypothetical protein
MVATGSNKLFSYDTENILNSYIPKNANKLVTNSIIITTEYSGIYTSKNCVDNKMLLQARNFSYFVCSL